MSLKNLFVGGELSKKSFLYRFLAYWHGSERIDAVTDSCELRLLLLSTTIGMLFLGALALMWVFGFGFAIMESVQEGTISASLATILIVAGMLTLAYTAPKLEKRWPRLVKWGSYVAIAIFTITAAALVLGLIVLFSIMIGDKVGWWICNLAPYQLSAFFFNSFCTFNANWNWVEGLLGFGILVLLGFALTGAVLAIDKIISLITHFRNWVIATHFWLWVKGKLCFPIEVVDS